MFVLSLFPPLAIHGMQAASEAMLGDVFGKRWLPGAKLNESLQSSMTYGEVRAKKLIITLVVTRRADQRRHRTYTYVWMTAKGI
jgi:hypothetical protein